MSDTADAAGSAKDAADASNVIDSEVLAGITQAAVDACLTMPETFEQVKSDLVWNMWSSSPNPYEDDFTKSSLVWRKTKKSEVNKTACKITTGEGFKSFVEDSIHTAMDPQVDPKIQAAGPGQPAAQAAYNKAVEKAADEAVEKAGSKLNEKLASEEKGGEDTADIPEPAAGSSRPGLPDKVTKKKSKKH